MKLKEDKAKALKPYDEDDKKKGIKELIKHIAFLNLKMNNATQKK